jgi:uncharacterized protein YjbI with pentapeptide repeats
VAFTGDACFDGATFAGDARFSGVTFTRDANFNWAKFTGDADFDYTMFTRGVGFAKATFTQGASFKWASFRGATFDEATFARDVTWESCQIEELSLDGAVAEAEVRVEAEAGRITARRLRCSGRISLRLRSAQVDLEGLVCAGPVSVHALAQPISGVMGLTADPMPVRVISLRGADAESLTLTDVDLSECRFAGLYRADQIQLDGRCTFASAARGRRRVLAEEHHWRADRRTEHNRDPGPWRPAPAEMRPAVWPVGVSRVQAPSSCSARVWVSFHPSGSSSTVVSRCVVCSRRCCSNAMARARSAFAREE